MKIKNYEEFKKIVDSSEPGVDYFFVTTDGEELCPYHKGVKCKYVDLAWGELDYFYPDDESSAAQPSTPRVFYRGYDCPGIVNCPYWSRWKRWRLRRKRDRAKRKTEGQNNSAASE